MTLTTRLLLGFVVVCGLGLYFLLRDVVERVERQYMEAAEEPMVDAANILASWLATQAMDGRLDTATLQRAMEETKTRALEAQIYNLLKKRVDMDVYVTDAQGRILYDSAARARPGEDYTARRDVRLTLDGHYGARSTRTDPQDSLASTMFVGAPVIVDGRTVGVVSVAKGQRSMYTFIHETKRWIAWTIAKVVLIMLLGVWLIARWAADPVRRLTEHARAISLGARPPAPRLAGREMRTLGEAFERMRDALEGREYVERYVQSLTHELKSPVAAIIGASEILQGAPPPDKQARFLENIHLEAGRLRDLLERLLQLAELEKQKTLSRVEDVDLEQIINRAWDHHELLASGKKLSVEKRVREPLKVTGDPLLLELALGNLIQNAIEFAPAGSRITLTLSRTHERAAIDVEDEGPGLPDFAVARVFERFYSLPRPDTGRKSSGLGLCFVREIALLHGGDASLQNRVPAPGAIGSIYLKM